MKIQITENDVRYMAKSAVNRIANIIKEWKDDWGKTHSNDPNEYRPIIIKNILAKHPEFGGSEIKAWNYYKKTHMEKREGNADGKRDRKGEANVEKAKDKQTQMALRDQKRAESIAYFEKMFPTLGECDINELNLSEYFSRGVNINDDNAVIIDKVDFELGEMSEEKIQNSLMKCKAKLQQLNDIIANKPHKDIGLDRSTTSLRSPSHPDNGTPVINIDSDYAVHSLMRRFKQEELDKVSGWIIVLTNTGYSTGLHIYFKYEPEMLDNFNRQQAKINGAIRDYYATSSQRGGWTGD